MSWFSDAVNYVPDLVMGASSALGYKSALLTNEAQAKEAEKNRKFQKMMSNTAHRREVRDLQLAGLNPILSANHGASTPSGSMAQFSIPADSAFKGLESSKAFSANRLNRELAMTEKTKQLSNRASADLNSAIASRNRVATERESLQLIKDINDARIEKSWFGKHVLAPMRKGFQSINPMVKIGSGILS